MQNLSQHAVKVNLDFLNFFHCKEAQQGVFFSAQKIMFTITITIATTIVTA